MIINHQSNWSLLTQIRTVLVKKYQILLIKEMMVLVDYLIKIVIKIWKDQIKNLK